MLYFSTYFFKLNNKSGRLLGGRLLVLSPYSSLRDMGEKKAILTSVKFAVLAALGQYLHARQNRVSPWHGQYFFQHLHWRCVFESLLTDSHKNMHVRLRFYWSKKKEIKSTACDKDFLVPMSTSKIYIPNRETPFSISEFTCESLKGTGAWRLRYILHRIYCKFYQYWPRFSLTFNISNSRKREYVWNLHFCTHSAGVKKNTHFHAGVEKNKFQYYLGICLADCQRR